MKKDLKDILRVLFTKVKNKIYPSCNVPVVIRHEDLFREYTKIINERYGLELNDVKALSQEISFKSFYDSGVGGDNANFYGDYYVLSKYAGVPIINFPNRALHIQHGMMYLVNSTELNRKSQHYLNWSSYMRAEYEKVNPLCNRISIGAPFFYADSILSKDEVLSEKKRLGHNLLAFPMHSTHFVISEYNPKSFLELLKQQRQKFDSVRVCLYWKDILLGRDKIYRNEGFECVCCGHLFDIFFLNRQKALFEIADATISNGIGSHLGYSIYMNKPTWLIRDEIKFVDTILEEGAEANENASKSNQIIKEFDDVFGDNEKYIITEVQKQFVDKYWGISDIKKPEEIRKLLEVVPS